jgi:hypothetical protein
VRLVGPRQASCPRWQQGRGPADRRMQHVAPPAAVPAVELRPLAPAPPAANSAGVATTTRRGHRHPPES